MNVRKTAKTTHRALGVAAGALLATVVGLWPLNTEADDNDSALADGLSIAQDETRAGAIEATSKLVQDEASPSKWYLEVRFVNRNADQSETAQFEERIQRTAYRPEMARAEPMPTAVWTHKERVALRPGEASVVRHALPRQLCAQLVDYARQQANAEGGVKVGRLPRSVTSYSTAMVGTSEPQGNSAVARAANSRPARSFVPSKVAGPVPDPFSDVSSEPAPKASPAQKTGPAGRSTPAAVRVPSAPLQKRLVVSGL